MVYQDNWQPHLPVNALLAYGTDHFVAGCSRQAALKFFDVRWNRGPCYRHTDGLACCEARQPYPEPVLAQYPSPLPYPGPVLTQHRQRLSTQERMQQHWLAPQRRSRMPALAAKMGAAAGATGD